MESYNDKSDKYRIHVNERKVSRQRKGKEPKEKYLYCIIKKINEFSVELWQVIVGLIIRYENYVCPNSVKSFPDIPFKPKPLLSTPPPTIFQVMFPFNEIICSETNILVQYFRQLIIMIDSFQP